MGKFYKFTNNVQALENSLTNFFAVGVISITSQTSESMDKELISSILIEQVSVFETIEFFCQAQIDTEDVDVFLTGLTKEIVKLTLNYVKSLSININDLKEGEILVTKAFNFKNQNI